MLKKRNIFVAILSFLFCLSINLGMPVFSNENRQNVASATQSEEAPALIFPDSGTNWEYDGDGTLTINGVSWSSQLEVSVNLKIVMTGDNSIKVDSGFAIVVAEGVTLDISGDGTLTLETNESSEVISCSEGCLTLGDEIKVLDSESNMVTNLSTISAKKQSLVIYKNGVQTLAHIHNFAYSTNGSELIATCTEDGCDLTDSKVSTMLTMSDLVYGGTLNRELDFTEFNMKTGLSLSDSDFVYEFYKVETKNSLTGGELVDSPSEAVGYYYLKATSNQTTDIGKQVLKCSFEVKKIPTTITSNSLVIKYNGEKYDLSQLFVFCENSGEKTYSIISENSTANGVIEGNLLTITKCGSLKVCVSTTGRGNYEGSSQEEILVIERADMVAGDGEGQLKIVISEVVNGTEYFDTGWVEGNKNHLIPEVKNNISGGSVVMTYWTDDDCSVPTTTEHGASETNGMPELMGVYYVKADIAETDLYNAIAVKFEFKIKRPLTISSNNSKIFNYKDIVGSKIDITKLFEFEEDQVDSIESIVYYLEIPSESKYVMLTDGKLEVTSITDEETGDEYRIRATARAKADSLYSHFSKFNTIVVKKTEVEIDSNDIVINDKTFDAEPISVDYQDFEFKDGLEIGYYLDAGCLQLVTENNGVPVSAGQYYLKALVSETIYTLETTKIIAFNITPIEVEIDWAENNFVYNSEVQEILAYYTDISGQSVLLNVSTDKEFKNVQQNGMDYTYTAVASLKNGEVNYKLSGSITKEYQIKPMKVTIQIRDRQSYIGSSPNELVCTYLEGIVFELDMPYNLRVSTEITTTTPVGKYEILAEETGDSNYEITFANTANYYVKNKIELSIQSWTWGEVSSEPIAKEYAGKDIVIVYYDKTNKIYLDSKPEKPGSYRVEARVDNDEGVYGAYNEYEFFIDKKEVELPGVDTKEHVYNHTPQIYEFNNFNNSLYEVVGGEDALKFRNAGTHKIQVKIKEFDYYRWHNNEEIYEFDFIIKKKPVEKPSADNRQYKYNSKPITYTLATNEEYVISNNVTQTEVGRYKIVVSLIDSNNTMWSDGTTADLEYSFVINQNQISASVTNSEGKNVSTNEVSIISSSGGGLSPEVKLNAEIFDTNDKEEINTIKAQLGLFIEKYDKIFKVSNVSLVLGENEIQPENNITLKMLVPEELRTANFRLYHIHIDENGNEHISEIEYSDVDENGYIVFQTDKLSSFVFVYKQSSLTGLIVTFACLAGLMLVLLIVQLIWFKKNKLGTSVVTASAVPVFYVAKEVASTITLGVLFGLLFVANIVFLILNLKMKNSNKSKSGFKKPVAKKASKAK